MTTREEKVVQIETTLRRRFFPHVADIDPLTDEQHEIKRLSRSLAAFALVQHCNVKDITAAKAVTDGSNDEGIDALYFDRDNNRLVFVQAKYKSTGAPPSQAEAQKTINGVTKIQALSLENFNDAIRGMDDDIREALDEPGIRLCLLFIFLGNEMNLHAANDLNFFCQGYSQSAEWHTIGLDQIYARLVEDEAPKTVDERITLENWAHVTSSPQAIYGRMSAKDLAQLVARHGTALFEQNIRHYLGSKGDVNSAIEETVRTHPDRLFYLNNGITAVARAIRPAGVAHPRRKFGVEGFSIVNGAQTAGAIANAMRSGDISPEAKIMVTVVEIGDDTAGLGHEITRARNHQNYVKPSDFAGLDENQERLRRQLALAGIDYRYRSSADTHGRADEVFTLQEAAVALACMKFPVISSSDLLRHPRPANAIDFTVVAKHSPRHLSDPENDHYRRLFTDDLSGDSMYRMVQRYRVIEQILMEFRRTETKAERKAFFRHARFFIIAFVNRRIAANNSQSQPSISVEERKVLSQLTDEISEEVYSALERSHTTKGHWAVFSNLTDVQQLADYLLRESARAEQGQITA